jgi:fibronectin-binding autotransporter adhesin
MKTLRESRIVARFSLLLTVALSLWAVQRASAETLQWIGVPGVTATTNWSDTANWNGSSHSPVNNQAQFAGSGGDIPPSTAINNVVNASFGAVWELDYIATNLNYTTLIAPGVTLTTAAGNGKLYVGCDQTVNGGLANAVETITITGAGGTLSVGGNLRVGQGCNSTGNSLHNVILDLSGLDNFIMTPTVSGTRLLVCGQSRNRAQGSVYLAKTNAIVLANDLEVGAMSTYSNTVPCGLYLGLTNLIFTGSGGVGSDTITVGSRGCTNGFMKFNPAFIGGANPPAYAYIGAPSNINGGRVNNFYVGYANGGIIPATGYCDLSGGYVNIMASTMQLGVGFTNPVIIPSITGTGILTYDNGIVDVNYLLVGYQGLGPATGGGGAAGIGIINMSTNCTLKVNNTLALAAYTGTAVSGDAGTINMNGGTLIANIITNGAGVGTINMTNATWQVAITPGITASANATVTTLNTGGATNTVIVTFAAPLTHLPSTNRLVKYLTLGGKGIADIGLVLPVNGTPYQGYLVNNSTASAIDLIITNGTVPPSLTWSGADLSGNWDVGTTVDWLDANTNATTYSQAANVLFDDTASGTTTVNLTPATQLTPATLTVNNASKPYAFTGSGSLGGAAAMGGAIVGGLTKQGSGTFVLAHTGTDTYLGGVNISAGVLQIGDGVTAGGGSLGPSSGAVINNAGLVFNRPDTITVANVISGGGGLTNTSGTLVLSGANTFTGPVSIAANTTLQLGNSAALGTTAGGTFLAATATLDLNGSNPGAEPITMQGTGSGSGAIVNNSSASIPVLTAVTLAGDTTFGGTARWDLRGTLSSGGHGYNVTVANAASGYSAEWRNLTGDASLGNITVNAGTILGWVGSTTAGTSGHLEVTGGATIQFYDDGAGANVNLTKPLILDDSSTIANQRSANLISAPISLSGFDQFDTAAGTSLTLSGPLSGNGTLYKLNRTGSLNITGTSPSFSGSVSLYAGKISLNGSLGSGTSSSITSQSGTILAGTGANNGPVNVAGGLTPGDTGVLGTNTFGSLTLGASATLTNDLAATASAASDLIVVNGDLTMNNGTIYLNPIGGTLEGNRPYTLLTYSGSFGGSLPAVQTASTSVYTIILSNATSLSPKRIQAIVTGGQPDLLVWDNAGNTAEWDVQSSGNWSNTVTHVGNDVFYSSDSVLFSDSITNSTFPATTIDIALGVVVAPSVITNNSTTNYTITGAGTISGGARIVKMGSSTLTLSNANDFSGPVTILGGTVLAASATALGSTVGTITITNGGTLDAGYPLGTKPIVVSGAGVGGNGAIVNNNSAHIWDSAGGLTTTLTLMGDTTFGGSNRWDLGSASGAVLSTGGHSNNLTIVGAPGTYKEWQNVTIDTNLANINILSAELGVKQMSALGNPTNTVTIYNGAQLTFWGGSNYTKNYYVKSNGTMLVRLDGPAFNLNMTLEGGAIFHSMNNVKTMTGPVTLLGVAEFLSDSNPCTFSNVISGTGGIAWIGNASQFAFAASNTYQGPTIIGNGLTLALLGNGSILNSSLIAFGGTDTNGLRMDVSGKADQTLTLASGQTLLGSGRINGALVVSAGATVSPGTNVTMGAIGADGAVTLNGTATMKIYNPTANDAIQSGTSISYGGTLNLEFLTGTLAAGNSWKLFNAPSYSGSFTLNPASPGNGLVWDTSHLTTDGTLRVISVAPPDITSITVGGGNVILQGTNGPANGNYVVLTSTNVAQSLNLWLPLTTNQFDGSGNFNWTNAITPSEPSRFYLLRLQ